VNRLLRSPATMRSRRAACSIRLGDEEVTYASHHLGGNHSLEAAGVRAGSTMRCSVSGAREAGRPLDSRRDAGSGAEAAKPVFDSRRNGEATWRCGDRLGATKTKDLHHGRGLISRRPRPRLRLLVIIGETTGPRAFESTSDRGAERIDTHPVDRRSRLLAHLARSRYSARGLHHSNVRTAHRDDRVHPVRVV